MSKSVFDKLNPIAGKVAKDFEKGMDKITFFTTKGSISCEINQCVTKTGREINSFLKDEYVLLTYKDDKIIVERLYFEKEFPCLEQVYVIGMTINGFAILQDGRLIEIWKYSSLKDDLCLIGYDEGNRTHNCMRGLIFDNLLVYTEWYRDYSFDCPFIGSSNIKYRLKQEEEEFSKNKETSIFNK